MVKYVLIACVLIASLGIGGLAPDCASNLAAGPVTAHVPCHTSFLVQSGGLSALQFELTVILAAFLLACLPPDAPIQDLPARSLALPYSGRPKPLTPPPRPI
jgi:hypothetical protein